MNSRFLTLWACLVLFAPTSLAQPRDKDAQLGEYYFTQGAFEKAAVYYKKVCRKYPSVHYFEKYFLCLFYQKKMGEAEQWIARRISKYPTYRELKFMLAQLYEATQREQKAEALYQQMVDQLQPSRQQIIQLGKAFQVRGKYHFAEKTYIKGAERISKGYQFQLELAQIYTLTNEMEKMIAVYLDLLGDNASYLGVVQNHLSGAVDFEHDQQLVDKLGQQLLLSVQRAPEASQFAEMLLWFYLNKKEFEGAVIQAKALDRRGRLRGAKVYEVGAICAANTAYSAALKAYQYVIDLGEASPYALPSVEAKFKLEFQRLTRQKFYTEEAVNAIADSIKYALEKWGTSPKTIALLTQLATIKAFYLNDPARAVALLQEAMRLPVNLLKKAQLKLLLGDVYIISDSIWEASLLYMQVEKDYPEDPIGHQAKFKNAKVFYYDGEFDYAKTQLDVLRASTSKLIANDAMQLSLLLQDNLGVDTTNAPVQLFANADLLLQQHQFSAALTVLDTLEQAYPFHAISDEVAFKKAEIYAAQQQWDKAIEHYQLVAEQYATDILGDDATYRIAQIYDRQLNDEQKAADHYKKILFEFKGSLYTAFSRERFNQLSALP